MCFCTCLRASKTISLPRSHRSRVPRVGCLSSSTSTWPRRIRAWQSRRDALPIVDRSTYLLASVSVLKTLKRTLTTFKDQNVRVGNPWSGRDFPPPSRPGSRTNLAGAFGLRPLSCLSAAPLLLSLRTALRFAPLKHCRSQLGCRSRRWPCRGGPSRSGGSSCGVRRVGPVAVAWASSTPELLPESTFSDPWVNSHEESRGGYTPPPANLVRNPSGCDP